MKRKPCDLCKEGKHCGNCRCCSPRARTTYSREQFLTRWAELWIVARHLGLSAEALSGAAMPEEIICRVQELKAQIKATEASEASEAR